MTTKYIAWLCDYAYIYTYLVKEPKNYNEISEFNELYQELTEIGDWDGLCMNLQVDMAVQNSLRMSDGRIEDKKRECLRAYFYGGSATWEGVIAAILQHPINKRKIAKGIAERHGIQFE